jgi:hypothetical protein
MIKSRGFATLSLMIFVLVALGIGGYFYARQAQAPNITDGGGVACTMEARLCPDGSYVGRQGPKCEFAACPTITN